MLQFLPLLLKPAVLMPLLKPSVLAGPAYLLLRRWREEDSSWEPAPDPPRPPEPKVQLVQCSGCPDAVPIVEAKWAPATPELTTRELEGWLCPVCWKSKGEPLERRYLEAVERAKDIEVFPESYRTRMPEIDRQRGGREISSRWELNRKVCKRQLQVAAAFHGFDVVVGVDEDKQPYHDGSNYIRSTFQWKGHAKYFRPGESLRRQRRRG